MKTLLSPLIISALALVAAGISTLLLCHAVALWRSARKRVTANHAQWEAAARVLDDAMAVLAARVEQLEQGQTSTLAPGLPKPGFNLSKRSQVLRMHRRGDSPENISAALDLPRQEVDLLLKVHRIVLKSF